MKLIRILAVLLVIVVLVGAATWYFTSFRPDALGDTVLWWANRAADQGQWSRAIRLYTFAQNLLPDRPEIASWLANAYELSGNYTKTEYTLVSAIGKMPGETALYAHLCRVYVRQDKLLDAVELLSSISNTAVREELDAQRPQPPVITPESGEYHDYISVGAQAASGAVYLSLDAEYPSMALPWTEPVRLGDGATTVTAVTVGENGLVSDPAAAVYTVGRIVREVSFTDPALEALAREKLGKAPEDAIVSDELWTITGLVVPEGTVTLADLALFEGLTTLTVRDLAGVDLTPVGQMAALEELTVENCRVSDEALAAIGGLTELKRLTLKNCGLATVQPLSGLTALEALDVSDNSIGSIMPLCDMTGLKTLNMASNAVTDLGPVINLKTLTALDLSGNPAEALPALPETLTELRASGCGLETLESLAGLPVLQTLDASGNSLTDVSPLASCENLAWADLSGNGLTDLEPLKELTRLATLIAGENQLTALPDFPEESILTTLEAPYNQLTDLTGLAGLARLNYLNVDYNGISDLTPLRSCYTLVQVSAYGCPVPVSQANALVESGVIVHYSPDYTAADPGLPVQEAPAEEAPVAEVVVGEAAPETAQAAPAAVAAAEQPAA